MKLRFLGAAGFVSGSCYLLETDRHKILIDCGMFQGPKILKERNYMDFPFDVTSIDAVLITHAHIDHTGLLPKLYKAGYQKSIYATEATVDLCSILLPDSGHIQEMEVERKNRRYLRSGKKLLKPIYTFEDGVNTINSFVKCEYNKEYDILENISITFRDAGHIMGSAFIEVKVISGQQSETIVFSGDLGRKNQNIIKDPEFAVEADYLLIESTYGNRTHDETKNRKALLAEIVTNTFKRGGNVIIPAFAVERTQDLLYDLNSLINEGIIKQGSIYIDSPLAIAATEVFSKHPEAFDSETQEFYSQKGFLPFLPQKLKYSRSAEDSKKLNEVSGGAIIISANGMAEAGRVRHHLRHNLWRPESSVIFVGYQAPGSLGRRLVDGEKRVRIFGEEITVKAGIFFIDAYSAHADYTEALDWLNKLTKPPKKVFLVHGEKDAAEHFANLITADLGWKSVIPGLLDYYDFEAQDLIKSKEGLDYKLLKAQEKEDNISLIYEALERIHNTLNKSINKKFNRDQYRSTTEDITKIYKLLSRMKS